MFMHCIGLPLTLNSHYCVSEFFWFYTIYKYCSCSQQSLLHIRAIFMHFRDLPVTLNSHYCAFENFYSDVFIHCTDLAIIVSSYRCWCELRSALFKHSIDLALFLNSHCCTFELCSANFMHFTVLLLTIKSHYRAFRLVSSLFMHSSDLACIFNHQFCKLGLYSSIFMYCIELPLILNSHYCGPEFFFNAFYKSCSCFQQSLLHIQALFCYIYAFHRPASHSQQGIWLLFWCFLFIAQTLLSLLAFINAHPSSNLVFDTLHRLCSRPQQSFLQVGALFCSFYAFHGPCSHS